MTAEAGALTDESATRAAVTIEVGRTTAWLHGYGLDWLLPEPECVGGWCPAHRRLTVPIDRVGDLLMVLEFRDRRPVELTAVDR